MEQVKTKVVEVRAYRRRWVILALHFLTLLINATPWMQYTVLADVATEYYGVGNLAVEWTALVYHATSIVLMMPAALYLDKYGLRPSAIIGALGTALGLWLRVLGSWPEHFWAVLLGHAIVSVSTNFVGSAPPRIVAVWFPANEVSTALGATMIGSMGGVTLGCLLAPLTARSVWTHEENFNGLLTMNLSLAILATVLLVAVVFWFDESPPLPPSPAQAAALAARPSDSSSATKEYLKSTMRICRNRGFMLLAVAYNLIVGCFVAITTLLNRDIMEFFPDHVAETGYLAALACVTGMLATVISGVVLDKTKLFKELACWCFFGGLATLVLYSVCVVTVPIEALYVVKAMMGFFMTSFFVPGYEYAVELTYPEPESNPTAILNWTMQVSSLIATTVYSSAFSSWGANAAHGFLVALMAIGFVVQVCVPKDYRRRTAELKALAEEGVPLKTNKV